MRSPESADVSKSCAGMPPVVGHTRWFHRTSLSNNERTVRLAGRSSIPCYYHQLKSESSGFIVSKRTGFFNFVTGVVDSTGTANNMHACDMGLGTRLLNEPVKELWAKL